MHDGRFRSNEVDPFNHEERRVVTWYTSALHISQRKTERGREGERERETESESESVHTIPIDGIIERSLDCFSRKP